MPPEEIPRTRENRLWVMAQVTAGGQTPSTRCPPTGSSAGVAHLEKLGDDAHGYLFGSVAAEG